MSFDIYTASAGSGKTFALVRRILEILLHPETPQGESDRILAITFTNKAAAEMKQRLLNELDAITRGEDTPMSSLIYEKLPYTSLETFREKAKQSLDQVLFHYDQWHFSTIDKWNLKLIKTFARELGVSFQANVEINAGQRSAEIIDRYLYGLYPENPVVKYLVSMIEDHIDEGKVWDISDDLKKLSGYILPDQYEDIMETLSGMEPQTIMKWQAHLRERLTRLREQIPEEAARWEAFLSPYLDDMSVRWLLPLIDNLKHFSSRTDKSLNKTMERWILNLSPAFKKNKQPDESWFAAYREATVPLREMLKEYWEARIMLTGIQPLAMLSEIAGEIRKFKETYDVIFISDFNKIIRKVVRDNPAPFIYWRLGQKLKHYFIDEFQDTSQIQWENLIPLASETFSGIHGVQGTVALFGDAKQSIYRFRGAHPEQFIGLTIPDGEEGAVNPFGVKKNLIPLDKNYRSARRIVEFNNRFFEMAGSRLPGKYGYVYSGKQLVQEPVRREEGYVEMDFRLPGDEETYLEHIRDRIVSLHERGYRWSDIAVLFPRNIAGQKISERLLAEGIPAISPDSLQLVMSAKVRLLVSLFEFSKTGTKDALFAVLREFALVNKPSFDTAFISRMESLSFDSLLKTLTGGKGTDIKWDELPVYDFFVHLAAIVFPKDDGKEDAYVRFFLDQILVHQYQWVQAIDFFDFWENELSAASIPEPAGVDAVRLMSIHKAKGLEFPVVLFVFPHMSLSPDSRNLVWLATHGEEAPPWVPVRLGALKKLVPFHEQYAALYEYERRKELFETVNLYYVAMTRARDELYVMPYRMTKPKKQDQELTDFQQILYHFVSGLPGWDEQTGIWAAGQQKEHLRPAREEVADAWVREHSIRTLPAWRGRSVFSVSQDEHQLEAVRFGRQVHGLLAGLGYGDDLEKIFTQMQQDIPDEEGMEIRKMLRQVVDHPVLKPFFSKDYKIYTERSIAFIHEGTVHHLRPDRICVNKHTGQTCIMEFKTGQPSERHKEQLASYMNIMQKAGWKARTGYLVYLNKSIEVIEIQ